MTKAKTFEQRKGKFLPSLKKICALAFCLFLSKIPVKAQVDPTEYPPGHPNVSVSATQQLQTFPVPRYKPGHTLMPNFNVMDPIYFGGYKQPGVSDAAAIHNQADIQRELAKNFNYMLNLTWFTGEYNDTCVALANANPQWKACLMSLRAQTGGSKMWDQNFPDDHYLQNSSGQFLNWSGGITSYPYKVWRPTAPPADYSSDGTVVRNYFNASLANLTRDVDVVNEDGEVYPILENGALMADPAVVAGKNASGLDWQPYLAKKVRENDNLYRAQFMTHPRLQNAKYTEYRLDGHPSYQLAWSQARFINDPINGQYYSTPDLYVRWPYNWKDWTSAWHGLKWITQSRYFEFLEGDKLFSPFVGAGWDANPEVDVRPAQWLGLLKIMGMYGSEFYYTGYFNEAGNYNPPNPPPNNPAGYAWQAVTPSYSQAITSRYEDILRGGSLMAGDMIDNSNPVTPSPFYQFSTGASNKVVIIRKSDSGNKYAITGAIENNSNVIGSAPLIDDAQITLNGQTMKFKIRRQGSTYIYDNTNTSAPVFYQLDAWHETSHPYYWSKDFSLEAELYDNTNAAYNLKTTVPAGTPAGDFRTFTTYITFPDAQTSFTPIEYVFTPRDASQATLYLWVKMRSRVNGAATGVTASVDNANAKTIGCVADTDWKWYRIDAASQQAIGYTGLTLANHILRLTPANSKVEIDQVVLSTNSNLGLTPEGPTCSVNCTATATANGPLAFCQGGNVVLTASSGASYLWSPGNQTTQSITASASGSYAVTVTQSNGCSATSTPLTVSVNQAPSVVISANGPTTFCAGDSVVLTSSSASSYNWSPGGQTTQSIIVAASGSYNVTVTDASGCSNTSASTSVTVHPLPAAGITASGPVIFYQGDSVILTASPGSSYFWLPDNQVTQSITVTESGTYSVLVTDANGCFAVSLPVVVTVNGGTQGVAFITPGGPTTFCEGGNVILTANEGLSYLWSTGETSQTITVNTAGSYVVTVTFISNTSTSTPVNVVVNPLPSATVTADDSTSFCEGSEVTLLSSPGASYLWAPGGQTTSYISVNASGSFSVIVTDNNGCSATSSPTDVVVYALPSALVTPSGPLTFNQGDSVILTSDVASSYLWSPGNQAAQSITVTASGTYSVLVTSAEGCTAVSSPVVVTVNGGTQDTASITAGGPLTFCEGGSVVLSANTGVSYLWSTGETTQSVTVNSSGSYVVTVTFASNISTSLPVNVIVNPLPAATITAAGATSFCEGGSVMLSASNGNSYNWTPGGETTQSITVSTSGSFAVTVTDGLGCSATSTITDVIVYPLPVAEITAGSPLTFNQGDSVVLSCGNGSSYLWQPGGQTTQSVTVYASGIYSVQITSVDGCTAVSAPVTVTVIGGTQDTAVITPSGATTFCDGGNVMLSANSGTGYLWSTGETTQSILVSSSGSYIVTITFSSNISVSDPVNVVVNPLPVAQITASGPLNFCLGGIVDLTSSPGNSYLWQPGGETTQTVAIGLSGSYTVNVTDINGCSATSLPAEVTVTNCNSCPVPTGLYESVITEDSATLNWNAVTGVDNLQIALFELPTWNTTITPLFSGTATEYTVSVEPNKWYLWWIRSKCGNSFTAWSPYEFFVTQSVRLADTTGNGVIGQGEQKEENDHSGPAISNAFEFGIYPNPASGTTTVNCHSDHDGSFTLQMMDVTGKMVKEKTLQVSEGDNAYQLDLKDLVKGMYMVLINDNGTVHTKRLIVD